MRIATTILTFILGIAACGVCQADGFFRRLPQVGEWARYDVHMEIDWEGFPPTEAVLTLRCVGEETIDGVEHLWLEARMDGKDDEGNENWTIIKVLVPAESVVEGDITSHIVRGWYGDSREETREMDLDRAPWGTDNETALLSTAFPPAHETVESADQRTIAIDGEEVMLTNCESGNLPTINWEEEKVVVTGESVWWPSADHAFGIAAAELKWLMTETAEENVYKVTHTSQISLVATGTDAFSDLPDHN